MAAHRSQDLGIQRGQGYLWQPACIHGPLRGDHQRLSAVPRDGLLTRVLLDVLLLGRHADRDRVGPADPLQLGRDIAVIQVGIVTAVAADDLVQVGVAALRLAFDHADRLARGTTARSSRGSSLASLPASPLVSTVTICLMAGTGITVRRVKRAGGITGIRRTRLPHAARPGADHCRTDRHTAAASGSQLRPIRLPSASRR
jgi:hypothetical protein